MKYTKLVMAVMVLMGSTALPVLAADVAEEANVRHFSGEIVKIDVKLGVVQVKSDMAATEGNITQYRINENDTRVTDPLDKKFLSLDNLQVGQYIMVDVVNGQEDKIVPKITAQPYVAPGLQQAFGGLQSIDIIGGTLTIEERPILNDTAKTGLSSFVFDPKSLVVMQYPNTQPVQLVLKSGDLVRVIYVVKDGKKWAQSVSFYTAEVTQTTVTTTTTTTH